MMSNETSPPSEMAAKEGLAEFVKSRIASVK